MCEGDRDGREEERKQGLGQSFSIISLMDKLEY